MKTLIIFVLAILAMTHQTNAKSTHSLNFAAENSVEQKVDLRNIQDSIMSAFMSSFVDQNNSKITTLIEELAASYESSNNSLLLYWKGYALYYNSIIYLKSADRKNAEIELKKGIEALESIKKKNSEDYALLSMLQSFSCQFARFPAVVKLSENAAVNINRAIEIDGSNLRAHYISANNDYYTPENYGGGKNVEEYALKAISLPAQKIVNPYLPSWGKQESYELLTNYYIRSKNTVKAKEYIAKGLKEFPNSYVLKTNQSKISK